MSHLKKNWQQELSEGFSNIEELCHYLNLSFDKTTSTHSFPFKVPHSFVNRMEKGNINDPLLKQVLPIEKETLNLTGYSHDPVGDINAVSVPGVIHKYHGRVLFITTGSCAINCRYCFRRNFPYSELQLSSKKIEQALTYIQQNNEISEVILSGGDPLLLSDQKLFSLINQLNQIPHIKRIRIHSRIPIVLPSRINADFCDKLNALTKPVILVIHANHQNELNTEVRTACHRLRQKNITLLNQSVLLRDINDNANQLCALSEKLFDFGVLPYYLHLLDKVHGTEHFNVEQKTAINIMTQVKKQLPGYLVPKLVREHAGADSKTIIA